MNATPSPSTKPPHPDQLDRPLKVSRSLVGRTAFCLAVAAAGTFVWSCVSTVPLTVAAPGMLISALGITDVNATGAGRISTLQGRVGDLVRYGTVVAEIDQADTIDDAGSKHLELQGYKSERDRLLAFQRRGTRLRQDMAGERRRSLTERIGDLQQRIASLSQAEANTRSLVVKGYELQTKLIEAVDARARAQDELAQAHISLIQLDSEEVARTTEDARELLGVDLKIARVERELEVLNGRLSRSTLITAPQDGRIVELTATVNEVVAAGRPVMRMLPAGGPETLQGVLFVPAEAGKRVRPGMTVQVVPANARLQRDGYMRARVLAVSDLPATREGMLRVLKNEALVQQLSAKGPPYEVTVALERDPASATGFAWSTGRGLPTPPESGTTVDAKLVVERVPVIALLGPAAEAALAWVTEFLS